MSSRFKPLAKGFTLIEIMIAMLIGVLLVAGLIQVFITSKQSYRMQESLSRLQESGRFALDFLGRDIRMAGYRGCASKSSAVITSRLTNFSAYGFNFAYGIQGFEAGTSTWTPTHSSGTTGISSPLAGSDIITIRRAGDDSVQIVSGGIKGSSLKISRNTVPGLNACDVAIASDCTSADLFQIKTWDSANKLVDFQTGGCSATSAGGNAAKVETSYIGGNLYKAITTSYYIKTNPNGQEALYRLINTNISPAEEELVEGVEKMQVYYGLDTDTDLLANSYVTASGVNNDWPKVVSVRISLLLKTIEDNIASKPLKYSYDGNNNIQATDRRIRRVFTTTIAIRNKLP